jgi:hypothetical protein
VRAAASTKTSSPRIRSVSNRLLFRISNTSAGSNREQSHLARIIARIPSSAHAKFRLYIQQRAHPKSKELISEQSYSASPPEADFRLSFSQFSCLHEQTACSALKPEIPRFRTYVVSRASPHDVGEFNTGALRVKLRRPPLMPNSGDEISAMAIAGSLQSSRTRSAGFPTRTP